MSTRPRINYEQLVWKIHTKRQTHTLFLSAATQKALTIFVAGLALTMTTLPKISFLPAFVAGFIRVLIMTKPGMVNLPAFFTSLLATAAKLSSTFLTSDPFNSVAVESSATIADFDMAAPPFIAAAPAFARGAISLLAGKDVLDRAEA